MYGLKSGLVGISRAELGGKVHKSGNMLEKQSNTTLSSIDKLRVWHDLQYIFLETGFLVHLID